MVKVPAVPPMKTTPCLPSGPGAVLAIPTMRCSHVLLPSASLLPQVPTVRVDADAITHIRQGRTFRMSPFIESSGARQVKAVSDDGELIAIGEARMPLVYHPTIVF